MGQILRLFATAAFVASAASASAAVLVVRSSGPSARLYPPGKALAENQGIALKDSDMVVLLDSRGTRTLRGPGSFSASASAAASSQVAVGQGGRRVRIQAVRGGPTGATDGRNVWQADVARSGNVCVANPADLGLYRSNASREGQAMLTDQVSGRQSAVHFDPGQSIASWPSDLPVRNGESYSVKLTGASAATLQVRMLAPVPQGLEGMAQSFIRNDCQAQLDVLIDTFTSPSAS
jgi:hypothetical protein